MWRFVASGLLVAALTGCGSTGPTTVRLNEEFVLAPAQSVEVEGTDLSVAFRRVLEDTRCPVDVFCSVAGNGSVELHLFGAADDDDVVLNTVAYPQSWTDGQFQIRLIDLEPVRKDGEVVKPEDYRARLVVSLKP
ncbi:MAG: hypothetical protein ABI647_09815 [Gemmatimonadota bacterium]